MENLLFHKRVKLKKIEEIKNTVFEMKNAPHPRGSFTWIFDVKRHLGNVETKIRGSDFFCVFVRGYECCVYAFTGKLS